ncbi:MAG TPA: branched-chain amino acid ABC transporter permease [Syntrophorhabdales bacterium]|nr:branched-chain amino acid ABC transporter permease [Syntrophorhabdales bacterium]
MNWHVIAQSLIFGIFVGGLYGLAAVGLSLVFGVMKMLNVAHGELLMLGGYVTFWFFSLYHVDPFLSLIPSAFVLFLLGMVLYKGLFSPLARLQEEVKIKNSMLVGFGLSLIFQNLAIRLWTADERSVSVFYSGWGFSLFGLRFPFIRLAGLILASIAILALHQFLTRTYFGKAIRATTENWESAALMGVNIEKTSTVSFAIGATLAAMAGTIVSIGYAIHPAMGLEWTLKALIVVVLAGLGNVGGAFAAGLLLGVVESVSTLFVGPYMEVVGLVIFLLVLELKPQGLFGKGTGG